ncbi:hypothetical protein HN588_07060 [Candidatus Bathyarchaeota archaeon]|nr:hypothetical protein [Candidatus Bathyarchaeota archaeon]
MPHHKRGAYDRFDSFAEVLAYYKRCRKRKAFILSEAGVELEQEAVCKGCGKHLSVVVSETPGYHGNRCDFYPRSKKIVVKHYTCAWGATLSAISRMG